MRVDPRAQVVRDYELGTTTVELEGSYVRGRPVRQGLRPGRFGEGVARSAEHGHEDLRLTHLAGLGVDHRHRLPGVVDEQFLAGAVLLAHHQVEPSGPFPVLLAEPAVLQPLGTDRLVLRRNADRPSVYKGFLIRQARFDATVYHGDRIRIEQQPPPGAGPRPPAGTVTGSGDDIIVHEGLVSGAHSRFPGHALTPTGVMAIRCKQFHLPDL